ncbi:MAG: hypothetical protein JSV89_01735 [Spirochaetaceae bacterium]|nr:MAG: hypothetical protein JSV89_01735 [Spirochaetaceae bacterium]
MSANVEQQQSIRNITAGAIARVVSPLPWVRILVAMILSLLPALMFKMLLHSDLPAAILFPTVIAVTGLGIAKGLSRRSWLRILFSILITSFAVITLIGLLITPYSVYLVWRDLLRAGVQRGAVSTLFTMVAALFSGTIAPMVLSAGVLWPVLLLGFALTTLLAVMLQNPALFYLVIGLIILCLVYQSLGRKQRRNPTAKIFGPMKTEEGRGGAVIYSVSAFVLILMVVSLLTNRQDPRQIRLVNERLHPTLRQTVVRLFPGFPLLYGIPGYGFSYNESKLGDPPSLSSRPIFEVSGPAGETLYLRTAVFDTYDGRSWKISSDTTANKGESVRPPFLPGRGNAPPDIGITLRVELYSRLPHTIDTINFRFPDRGVPIAVGTIREGIRIDPPLTYGDTLLLERGEPLYRQTIDVAGATTRRSGGKTAQFLQPYLQVPANLPREVRELAGELADPGVSRTVLRNIERYITANHTYSLNPEAIAVGDDFVRGFLFDTKEGFCVHFATSFVILARLNGIPARYVTGFLTYLPDDGSPATVTGHYAHAWPEVWIEGEGWVHWEATRALDRTNYDQLEDGLAYEFDMELDRETSRQIQAVLGSEVRNRPEEAAGPVGGDDHASPLRRRRILLVLTVVLGILGGVYLLYRSRKPDVPALRLGREARFHRRTRRLARRLNRLGIPPPTQSGWTDWGSAVQNRFPRCREMVSAYCDLLCAYLYGGQVLDPSWERIWKRLRNLPS